MAALIEASARSPDQSCSQVQSGASKRQIPIQKSGPGSSCVVRDFELVSLRAACLGGADPASAVESVRGFIP
jgi:hypothetical protein